MIMANVGFTRDEIILALDALYSSEGKSLSPNSETITELSATLNKLPIHPEEKCPANFRNCVGVSHQIDRFKKGYSDDPKAWNVSGLFFQIDAEYKDKHDELHAVAAAIRRNIPYYSLAPFGSESEYTGFPEGALLSHLHRIIENRDGRKLPLAERCMICQLAPDSLYQYCGNLLQNHLVVAPCDMNGSRRYSLDDFITVCPNCHAALHQYRPWLSKEKCSDLLR